MCVHQPQFMSFSELFVCEALIHHYSDIGIKQKVSKQSMFQRTTNMILLAVSDILSNDHDMILWRGFLREVD